MLEQDSDLDPLSAAVPVDAVLGLAAAAAEQALALEHEQEQGQVRAPAAAELRTDWVPSMAGTGNVD